jgi:hypothetical protein
VKGRKRRKGGRERGKEGGREALKDDSRFLISASV